MFKPNLGCTQKPCLKKEKKVRGWGGGDKKRKTKSRELL
jgi:hypothetical protein